ncbi:MAG: hypothetical protein JWP76_1582, partial [Dactylosporangium sp.]|nr:hypothetical protein [Dactylosporangium sp.]
MLDRALQGCRSVSVWAWPDSTLVNGLDR